MKTKLKLYYELGMFVCVMLSVGTIWFDSPFNLYIIWWTWAVFLVDYVVRLKRAEHKWAFIRANVFDFIALIPLDAIFQTAKLARLFRLMRMKTIAKHYANPLIRQMHKNQFPHVVSVSFIIMFIATLPFYYYEPVVNSFQEAFRWSALSMITFGNSELQPQSWVGKAVIISLTILGVALHAFLMTLLFKTANAIRNQRLKEKYTNKGSSS